MANFSDLLTFDEQATWGAVLGDYYKQRHGQSRSSREARDYEKRIGRINELRTMHTQMSEAGRDIPPDYMEEVLRQGYRDLRDDPDSTEGADARRWIGQFINDPHMLSRMRRQLGAKKAGMEPGAGTAAPRMAGEQGRAPSGRAQRAYQEDVSRMGQATVQGLQGQQLQPGQQQGIRGVAGAGQLMPNEEPLGAGQAAGYYAASAASPWVGLAETGRNLVLGAPDEPLPPPRSLEEAGAQSMMMQGGMPGAPNLAALGPYVRYGRETLGARAGVGQVGIGLGLETASAGGMYTGVGGAIGAGTRAVGGAVAKRSPTLMRGVAQLKKFGASQLAKSKAGEMAAGGILGTAQRFVSRQAVALMERMAPELAHGIEAGVGFHALHTAEVARTQGASEAVKHLGTLGLRVPDALILLSGGDPHSPVWKERAAAENAGQRFPWYLTVLGNFDIFNPEGFAMLAAFPPATKAVLRGAKRAVTGRGGFKPGTQEVAPPPVTGREYQAPAIERGMPLPTKQGELGKQFIMSDEGIPIPRNVIDAEAIKTYIEETGQLERGMLDSREMREALMARGDAEGATLENRLMSEQARSYGKLVEGQLDSVLQGIRTGKIENPNNWLPETVEALVELARTGDMADNNTKFALQAVNWLRYADIKTQATTVITQASGKALTPLKQAWDAPRFRKSAVGKWLTENAETAPRQELETRLEELEKRVARYKKDAAEGKKGRASDDTIAAYEGLTSGIRELVKRRFEQPEAPAEGARGESPAPPEYKAEERRAAPRDLVEQLSFDELVKEQEVALGRDINLEESTPEAGEARRQEAGDMVRKQYRIAAELSRRQKEGVATPAEIAVLEDYDTRHRAMMEKMQGQQGEAAPAEASVSPRPTPPGIEYKPRSLVMPERYRGGLKFPAPRGQAPGEPAGPFYGTEGTRGRGPTTLTGEQAGGLEAQPARQRPTIAQSSMDAVAAEREAPQPQREAALRGAPEPASVRAQRTREAKVYSNPDYSGPEEFAAALRDARRRGDRGLLQLTHSKIIELANMTRTVPEVTTQRELPVVPWATSALKGPEPVRGEPLETRTFSFDELLPTPRADVENTAQAKNIYRHMLRTVSQGMPAAESTVARPLRERGQVVGAKQLEDLAMAIDEKYVRDSRNQQQADRGQELSRHLVEKYDQLERQAEIRTGEQEAQQVEGFEAIPGSELQSGRPMHTRAGEQRLHTESRNEYVDELYRRRGEIEDELMGLEWGSKNATTDVDLHVDRDLNVRVERILPALPGGRLVLRDGRKKAVPAENFDSREIYSFENQEFTIGDEKIPLHMVRGVEQSRANLKFKGREVAPDELLWVLEKVRGEAARLRDEGAKRKRPTMSEQDWNDVAKEFLVKLPNEALGALSGYMQAPTPASGTVWADFPSPVWGNSADYRSTKTGTNFNLQRAIWEIQRARAQGEGGGGVNQGELPVSERRGAPPPRETQIIDGKVRGKMSGMLAADPYLNVKKSNKVVGFRGVHGKLRTIITDFLNLNWRVKTHPDEPYVENTRKGFDTVGKLADTLAELSDRDFDLARTDGEAMTHALDEVMRIAGTPGSAEDAAAALAIDKGYVTVIKDALTKQRKYWRADEVQPLSKMVQIMMDITDRVGRTREGTPWEDVAPEPEISVETTKAEREVGAFNAPRMEGAEIDTPLEERTTARDTMREEADLGGIYEPPGRGKEISFNEARRVLESALRAFEENPNAFRANEAGEITDLSDSGQPGSLARLAQLVRDAKREWNTAGEMTWDDATASEAHAYATALKRYIKRNYPGVPHEGLKKAYATEGTPRSDQLLESEMPPEHYTVSKAAVEQREAGVTPEAGTATTRPRQYQMNAIAQQLREALYKLSESGGKPDEVQRISDAAEGILEYSQSLRRHEEYVAKQHTAYLKYRRNLSKKLRDAGMLDVQTGEATTSKMRRTRADMLKQEAKRLARWVPLSKAYGKFLEGLLTAEDVLGRQALIKIGLGEGRGRGDNMLALLEHQRNPSAKTQRAVESIPIETRDLDAVDIKIPGDTPEVAMEAPKKGWAVDAKNVEWGPVFTEEGADVSTTHVLVRYVGGENQRVPFKTFFNMAKRSVAVGKDLNIEFLRVSPEVMANYATPKTAGAGKWDTQVGAMTDWADVGKRFAKMLAYSRASRAQQMRGLEQSVGVQLGRVPKGEE